MRGLAVNQAVGTLTVNQAVEGRQGDDVDRHLFGIRRSVLYHRHRQSFFDGVNDIALLIAALAGSGAVVGIAASAGMVGCFGSGSRGDRGVCESRPFAVPEGTAARRHCSSIHRT